MGSETEKLADSQARGQFALRLMSVPGAIATGSNDLYAGNMIRSLRLAVLTRYKNKSAVQPAASEINPQTDASRDSDGVILPGILRR